MSPQFGFSRLDVYRCAIDFVGRAYKLVDGLSPGHHALADQLKRASVSIPLNIAEGAGRVTARDINRYRVIARGSAMECVAILDVLEVVGQADAAELEAGRSMLLRIVQMLSKLVLAED